MLSKRLILLSLSVTVLAYTVFFASAATLPKAEVEALREIARTLGKKDWNFSVDPCSGEAGWVTVERLKGAANAVGCNCSYLDNTVCHVVSIELKSQNLPGVLPPELVKLPYLQQIDLTRNYLNGSIPKEWGSMQLVNISLFGNRISGHLPTELTNIATLRSLTLDFNQLSGVLPPELGDMASLERLFITSNNFTGPLPGTLAKLTTLKDFRISDNQFSGKIPNFIQNWINLEKIMMQASGLEGPIPSGISLLTKLTDMRISDLNGTEATFPPLSNMKDLKYLILRSCNIVGELPAYLGGMTTLKVLDLSFNKLTGQIPRSFDSLNIVDFIYFTGNELTGAVPEWMNKAENIDLSYNNFTLEDPDTPNCQQQNVNLFGSSSIGTNSIGVVPCLKSFRCPKKLYYSFHINCGGRKFIADGGTAFDDEMDSYSAASRFYRSSQNWAFSSTGNFLDNDRDKDIYIATNTSVLTMKDYQLYTNARLSPTSLTYYGFCLLNGNYTVKLHFAEIMFTDDKTFSSLGRRIFDVYIQGNLVLKDFNIEDEAGGVGKAVIKKFTVIVTGTTLEIRFYWAGKGTTRIPGGGVYGPLVSAISVDPDFTPPPEDGENVSPGLVVGIVLSVSAVIVIVLGVLWWKRRLGRRKQIDKGPSFKEADWDRP